MNRQEIIDKWKKEENDARIKGWDFSGFHGRYEEDPLPWDYKEIIMSHLRPDTLLLDMDTGGAEFLLSLHHTYQNTAATEGYLPNIACCTEKLLPLGIDFRSTEEGKRLPFENNTFDLVINRHGGYLPDEVHRVLKTGGLFITQQVGAENNRKLARTLLLSAPESPFPDQYMEPAASALAGAGFSILDKEEAFLSSRFYDMEALIRYVRIIEWEFPRFSVETSLSRLFSLKEQLDKEGCIKSNIHRYFLKARKSLK